MLIGFGVTKLTGYFLSEIFTGWRSSTTWPAAYCWWRWALLLLDEVPTTR